MKKMICEVCEGSNIRKIDESTFECQDCGMQYALSEAKKLLKEISETVPQPNTHENSPSLSFAGENISYENDATARAHSSDSFTMTTSGCFYISGRGTVVTGKIITGRISTGQYVHINGKAYKVTGIEKFRQLLDTAEAGMDVGILISSEKINVPAGITVLS